MTAAILASEVKMKILILTGASGAGKTTIAKEFALRFPRTLCFYFDSIGVPPETEMIAKYGSGQNWQKQMTVEWLKRLKVEAEKGFDILFEGQSRIEFILDAIQLTEVKNVSVVLVDCNDNERRARLVGARNQPELATDNMMNWAAYLRSEANQSNIQILDTSNQKLSASIATVEQLFAMP